MQPTLSRIKLPVSDVPHVNLPQHGISFSHPLQDTYGTHPKDHRQANAPPGAQTKAQSGSRQRRDEHQFPIPAQQLVGPVDGRVDQHGSRCGSVCHG